MFQMKNLNDEIIELRIYLHAVLHLIFNKLFQDWIFTNCDNHSVIKGDPHKINSLSRSPLEHRA